MPPSLTARRLPPIERSPRVSNVRALFNSIKDVRSQLETIANAMRDNYQIVHAIASELIANEVKQELMSELIDQLREENSMLRMHTHHRDDTIARLHRRLGMFEEHIERAERALRREDSDDVIHCLCCFDVTNDFIRCSGDVAHAFCKTCIDTQCRVMRSDPCTEPMRSIPCMSTDDCRGHIFDIQTTKHGDEMLADFYTHQSMKHILPLCSETAAVRLTFMRSDGTFRGLQCRACGYGPLWNENCSELITHHAQRIETGGQIDNTCPRCGSFVHDTAFMDQWNGTTHNILDQAG